MGAPRATRQDAVREAFEAAGQAHVFAHWGRLGPAERESLLGQAAALAPRLERLTAAWRATRAPEAGSRAPRLLEPATVDALPEYGGDAERLEQARARGLELLEAGRVAAFVVAGGQGTRLGFDGPKGCYPVGPVTDRTLFRLQAQKIAAWRRRTGRALPWYVMTSPATHAGTIEHFEAARFFGLPASDVRIFLQETVPAFDDEGRFFLERPDRIFENPAGHGASLAALLESGSLDDMDARGIDHIFYYQVDNPLVRIADPAFLGLHDLDGAEVSCKVIRKEDPMEKVGVVARVDGRLGIVEYTELTDADRHARDAQGRLVFWAGSIATHCFDTAFARRAATHADQWLPMHASRKQIPFVDRDGRVCTPREPNGDKLERFVFDVIPHAARVCVQEVRAVEEFAPIKNAEGKDSPATARVALLQQYRDWLKGTPLEDELRGRTIEIDHARAEGAHEVQRLASGGLDDIRDAIFVATGNDA